MKYGETLSVRSVPQWAPYNVDYDTLKHIIKANTTRDAAQAVTIPGQQDSALRKFEGQFFNELYNQHERVDLFVRSKADEIHRRLEFAQQAARRLRDRSTNNNGRPLSQKKLAKFAKYEGQIIRCGEDIRLLERFVKEQRVAFYKIFKKYKKWTGSRSVEDRFNFQVLNSPKSFTKMDFDPLFSRYTEILATLRTYTPENSQPVTPITASRRQSSSGPAQQTQPVVGYWNEYDDGSEVENEPYMISVQPASDTPFPGSKAIEYIISRALGPVEKIKVLFRPVSSYNAEQQPLLQDRGYFTEQQNIIDTTDAEDDGCGDTSSLDLPNTGYMAHYATFPSISKQHTFRNQEKLLFRSCIVCFCASVVFLLIAGILGATGRHRLRVEVDAGVITGVVASLFFGILGLACMLHRRDRLDWLHRSCVLLTFATVCMLDGMVLVFIMENMAP